MNKLEVTWRHWKFKYITYFLIGLIVAVFLAQNDTFHQILTQIESLEYIGAFLAGILFVSSFTIATATVVIAILAQDLNPFALALIGGAGAVIGDLIIFRFVKDHLTRELGLLLPREEKSHLKILLKSPYIAWMLPIIGGLIIASPLPDELGISLLGMANTSQTKLIVISYLSNAFGILAIASVAKVF